MNSELLAFLFKLIIVPAGFFMIWVQDKFTWTLYRKYHELWERLGAPGGFFWCPEGRRLRANIRVTSNFWYENQFGLATEIALPDDIQSFYKIYIRVYVSMLIIFALFILSLFWLHLYEAGGGSAAPPITASRLDLAVLWNS